MDDKEKLRKQLDQGLITLEEYIKELRKLPEVKQAIENKK